MILTKRDFENFGFKHVIEYELPVMLICNRAVCAKVFNYKSIENLKEQDWFIDSLNCQSPILLCTRFKPENDVDIYFKMYVLSDQN